MRRSLALTIVITFVLAAPSAQAAGWRHKLDRLVRGRSIGIAVADDGVSLYRHRARAPRIPASNQKLLLSMALLDRAGADLRFETTALVFPNYPTPPSLDTPSFVGGVVEGDLWVLGSGDPTLSKGRGYARQFAFSPTRLGHLARAVKRAGVTRIEGSVRGSTTYFGRDWFAPGWESDFPRRWVALPSALALNGNVEKGVHIRGPVRRAARALTSLLRDKGIAVAGAPGYGVPPEGLVDIGTVTSPSLLQVMTHMNRRSSNFFAEMLGKRLGLFDHDEPGTIAKGAATLERWAAGREVEIRAHDSSGLSYANRVSPRAIVRLLRTAENESWGGALTSTLPRGGQGTLVHRLEDVNLRAKTGTLEGVSALAGWLWLERRQTWAEFSIISNGIPKWTAVRIEDEIVRVLANRAR